jgi:hypothetical protein
MRIYTATRYIFLDRVRIQPQRLFLRFYTAARYIPLGGVGSNHSVLSPKLETEVMPDHVHILVDVDPQFGHRSFIIQRCG